MVSGSTKTQRVPQQKEINILIGDDGLWTVEGFEENTYRGKSALPLDLNIFENKNPAIWSQLLFQEKLSNWNYIPIPNSIAYEISKKFLNGQACVRDFIFYSKSKYPDANIRDYIRDGSFEAFLIEPFGNQIEIKLLPFNRNPLTSNETIIIPKTYDDFIQEAADVRQYFYKFAADKCLMTGQTIILNERQWHVDSRLNLNRV